MKWFYQSVVYQIYPRSFKDSNGDGIGDLNGIRQQLDYLKQLGIGAIWLSPFYPSPMKDFGYDISNYCDVNEIFGTLEDFDALLKEAHARDIRIIIDYVPNHTSDMHPWFLESRSSKDNPKRDWYLWKDAESPEKYPNNWLSVFGGSGWEYDEHTKSFYFHSFLKEQPDLNWRNPEVVEAMKNVLKFWLDRGVDGFRMDVAYHIIKHKDFLDDPINPNYVPGRDDPYWANINSNSYAQPEALNILRDICNLLSTYEDKFLVMEVYAPIKDLIPFFELWTPRLHAPFNMNLIGLPWTAESYSKIINDFEAHLKSDDIPNYVLGNHDKPRVASRLGQHRARLAAMLQLTLRGMPFVYYGEELGMEDVHIPFEDVQDPFEKRVPGLGLGRDPARTPMQWENKDHAGFSTVKPWLPVPENFFERTVQTEEQDPKSMLNLYKILIHTRDIHEALLIGTYKQIETNNPHVYAYTRSKDPVEFVTVLNFSDKEETISLNIEGMLICNMYLDMEQNSKINLKNKTLRPAEGLLIKVK